jgi:catechol 2,3-dioxygenase-like lactoylglutathione lyase family enzyme
MTKVALARNSWWPSDLLPDRLAALCARHIRVDIANSASATARIVARPRAASKSEHAGGGIMIIDHIGLAVSDYEKSKEFFAKALAPLGIGWAGLGKGGKPELWFGTHSKPQQPLHIAFAADNREQVREFYKAALAAGAVDNGPPGIREMYHPNYYGAFVIGPDGHNVEAVCHAAEA